MKLAERLSKLLAVKSIVTLALTAIFCVLALDGVISDEFFQTIFSMVIAFYFGVQHEKKTSTAPAPVEDTAPAPVEEDEPKEGEANGDNV